MEPVKEVQLNMDSNIIPVFADEVVVSSNVKQEKENEKLRKEGNINLLFIDRMTNRVVSRVVMNSITARQLSKVLVENVNKFEEIVENDKELTPPKEAPKKDTSSVSMNYFN